VSLRPEQERARAYLAERGTALPAPRIAERVGAAFAATQALLGEVRETEARRAPGPGEWAIQEVVDHLVETHRASLDELRALLAGRRPDGGPIPAALQSAAPLAPEFADLVAELRGLHARILEVLHRAPDRPTSARAPVVMVVNARDADGVERPLHWIEELDWKAYAIVFRLHELDHAGQVKKALRALRADAGPAR
jgi:hypothetical protein